KRIRDFDPRIRPSRAQFTRELVRERGGRDGKRHLLGKARGLYQLLARADREPRAPGIDGYLFEHCALDHDPRGFFRRGWLFVTSDTDAPAPSYLGEARGPMGEDLPCFSADYGHWDGVLAGCVGNVARQRPYERGHLAKLLAGNCLRFYGERLARAL